MSKINLVMFSGGLSSAICALYLKQKTECPLHLLFTDTKIEDEDLYRFVDETVEFLKPDKYIYLCDGRTPWEVFKDVKFLGNSRVDPCSRILKRDLANNYVKNNYKINEVTLHFGIHWSESERLEKVKQRLSPYSCSSVLCNSNELFLNHSELRTYWEENAPIKVPRLYDLGFTHNNCGGFCVKAGKKQFLNLNKHFPDLFDYHANQEQELSNYLGKPYTILREQKNNKKIRLSLKELKVRTNIEDEHFIDNNGCSCFID